MRLVVGVEQLFRGIALVVGLIEGAVDVELGHVERDELHVRILVLRAGDGAGEGIAGHHDDIVALVNGLLDHGDTVRRAVAGGLVVSELNVVFRAEGLAGFIRGLVEGLVGDVTVVRDHGDLVRSGIFAAVVLVAAAGAKREDHDERKEQSNKLLHVHAIFPP